MRHEPSGAVRAEAEHPPELMRGHALFAGGHEMRCQKPLVEWNVRPLVKSAHGRCEGLSACAALIEASARALAL
jgi:hypothetical protein